MSRQRRQSFPMNKHKPKSIKAQRRLDIRVMDYEKTRNHVSHPEAYTCPGSMKK